MCAKKGAISVFVYRVRLFFGFLMNCEVVERKRKNPRRGYNHCRLTHVMSVSHSLTGNGPKKYEIEQMRENEAFNHFNDGNASLFL